ncbi:MAG: bifunctional 4-hydroxy-2-oxoglutarate aldolase/2-dehydro-3-deoxy-phosphogluconate aldolase [Pirellula sp.]
MSSRLVAIVRLEDLSQADRIAETLLGAGIRALEFTLTNSDSPSAVRRIRESCHEMRSGGSLIGLGSVRSLEEAKIAVDCGAQFVVSPITSIPIIEYCKSQGILVCPGAYTPTEIAAGWDAGADVVKVFPARSLGPNYVRDVLAPMPYLKLMPTGGIDLNNIQAYLGAGAVAVGIGSQLLDPSAIRDQDWGRIKATAERYVQACATNGPHANGRTTNE